MPTLDYRIYHERHLPHYQPPGATLFITFRLAESLPPEVINRLQAEAQQKQSQIARITSDADRKKAAVTLQKRLFASWDAELDAAHPGPHWLADPAVARLVFEAIHDRDGKLFTLDACCIMPNHVHLVCTPLSAEAGVCSLSKILHSLKGFTAYQANKLLGRQGAFWQHESYDHVVRDSAEYQRIVNYVLDNPIRAGLPPQWIYCREM